ncbi:DUF2853 family protein [Mangrovimonas sp. YM274]|uniref:DUF2853 family protein n=1 Tax=Mangrovimonas sp. YM274 TaxID=3070660 RepID=UPI0027DD5B65|nr:DUF2853 family protein [Mangrovimonas sp. YM274]WMI69372.1 DUF2853 family protein [Mangrovimonas sp. YM274]
MNDVEAKLSELKEIAVGQLNKCGVSDIDHAQLDGYVNSLKTMVDNHDASLVAAQDPSELETVRRNFVEKKLGITDKDKAMAAITKVAETMSEFKNKNRPAFYYLVAKELG